MPAALGGGREAYDAVTARAVGPLALLVEYAAPLLREGGVLVAWKGARDAGGGGRRRGRGRGAGHGGGGGAARSSRSRPPRTATCTSIRKIAPTPPGFPRRAGMARKRPLG